MPASGLSVVGHQLRDGQTISVRFDVCTSDGCVGGTTKEMVVRVRCKRNVLDNSTVKDYK